MEIDLLVRIEETDIETCGSHKWLGLSHGLSETYQILVAE